MKEDCQNWEAYKSSTKSKLIVKPDLVPHKYLDKPPDVKLLSQFPMRTQYSVVKMEIEHHEEPLIESTVTEEEAVDPFEAVQCLC